MTADLQSRLSRLGLVQYTLKFEEEGFETWERLLDITESDLDTLGVKLGHRRVLQREIALAKGVSVDYIISPTRQDSQTARPEESRIDGKGNTGAGGKRKYRRHPKADESAPERPPSAYVIFSNIIREELKPENLTFTVIAKRVGERWQDLPAAEKEPFEAEASLAKEKYHAGMAEYKTTKSYREYQQYLAEFKAKNASNLDEKRPKLAPENYVTSNGSRGSLPPDSFDSLSSSTAFQHRRVDSMSSGGACSTASGLPSPASVMSGPAVMRGGITSMIPLGNVSPLSASSPSTSSIRMDSAGPLPAAGGNNWSSKEAYPERTAPSGPPGHHFSRILQPESRESQRQQLVKGAPSGLFIDPRLSHGRDSPLDYPRRSTRIPALVEQTTSDTSSKSSIASTLSSGSTGASSLFPSVAMDEGSKAAMSLPPLSTVTLGTFDEPLASRNFPTPQSSQSPFSPTSSSTGMKFESLQLPLPYNISFGQRPLSRPEHEEKLANIFDLQDIPRERKSLKNLSLEQEHAAATTPTNSRGSPELRHPAHHSNLPTLPALPPRQYSQDNILQANADPLSVLAYAGRLVGQRSRSPS